MLSTIRTLALTLSEMGGSWRVLCGETGCSAVEGHGRGTSVGSEQGAVGDGTPGPDQEVGRVMRSVKCPVRHTTADAERTGRDRVWDGDKQTLGASPAKIE